MRYHDEETPPGTGRPPPTKRLRRALLQISSPSFPSNTLTIPVIEFLARRARRTRRRTCVSAPSTLPVLRYRRAIGRSGRRVDDGGCRDGRLRRSGRRRLGSGLRGTGSGGASGLVDHRRGSWTLLDGIAAGELA